MQYMTEKEWYKFSQLHPGALGTLRRLEIEAELHHWQSWEAKGLLGEWQKTRLAELREWDANRIPEAYQFAPPPRGTRLSKP